MKWHRIFILFIFLSCLSTVEKIGMFLDGTNEKILEQYLNEEHNINIYKTVSRIGKESLVITLGKYPVIKIRGSIPQENGVFYLTSLDYLAGNDQGWNEFSLALLGEGTFTINETASFKLNGRTETVQIVSGRIHRRDTRITAEEAVTALRNRRERILALIEWISKSEAPRSNSLTEFENYWKPILLPEQVSNKERPDTWHIEGDVFVRAESIRWNTSYTERIFPENLHAVRNSGTLLRDWEETLAWIYIEYEWNNIIELLQSQLVFIKIK